MSRKPNYEYGKIKVGTKTLDDAVINLGAIQKSTKGYIDKWVVLKALYDNDVFKLREISNYFYKTSGIYSRLCNYVATMYRYDWYVVPEVYDDKTKSDKIMKDFHKVLTYMDNSYVAKICGEMALGVVKNGAYYGYLVQTPKGVIVQELPVNYCRSRYSKGNLPVVEFNMKFFDIAFPDTNYRMKVLNLFPDEFKKGYYAYRKNKLSPDVSTSRGISSLYPSQLDFQSDDGWWLLDANNTVKFSFPNGGNGSADLPLFINVIPAILDLDAAQDLDRRKQMQKLLKIVVQKLPLDKNGDLIFDVDEARDIHNNAVEMLRRAVGVDVLTTFADIESIDMADKNTTATQDDLAKVERAVYNASGTSQNMFNTDGNMALEKSVLNDEGMIRALLLQFEVFFDRIVQSKGNSKYNFRLYMLETTQYNYKDLAKMYKEQVQLGYSKMLPQIAMGHSQSSILNTAYFENEVMNLSELMIPPLMSSTMNMQDLKGNSGSSSSSNSQKTGSSSGSSGNGAGRPEKPNDQKSEKTIKNKESMS